MSPAAAVVQLLDLLDHCLLADVVVLLAAPALARILISKPEVSVDTLERSEALGTLAQAIKRQARAAQDQHGTSEAQARTSTFEPVQEESMLDIVLHAAIGN